MCLKAWLRLSTVPLPEWQWNLSLQPDSVTVGVRLSATDWVDGGRDVKKSITFSQQLEAAGSDYIHVFSGGLSPQQKILVASGYRLPYAHDIRRQISIPVIGVGLITAPQQAELREGAIITSLAMACCCVGCTGESPSTVSSSRATRSQRHFSRNPGTE